MKIMIENTIDQYEKLFSMQHNKEHFFRYTMMKPFEKMWNMINVPLKAKQQNGYDVIMATTMLGYLDISDTQTGRQALKRLQEIPISSNSKYYLASLYGFYKETQPSY